MNIEPESLWQNLDKVEESQAMIDFAIPGNIARSKTKSPLMKIKKSLQASMVWIAILLVVYISAFLIFQPIFTRISLLVLAGYSVYSFIYSFKFYRQISPDVIAGNSVIAELERHYSSITRWCKAQELNALFLYPISILGGAILGLSTAGAEKMDLLMHKPNVWAILLGFIIIITPVLFYITRWMMKVAYYKHLEHLRVLIELFDE